MSTTIPDNPALTKRNKTTTLSFLKKKEEREPITELTAYDYPTATAMDQVGVDAILVGDSLGMVVLGYANTLSVTMDDMLHHCKAVKRGVQYALLIGDMPFMSYQVSVQKAVRNAGRFLQEAGMDAVKLEGGEERLDAIRAIIAASIPVQGHLGLTPQSIKQLGGFRPQGITAYAAKRILEDALMLEDAGCFSLVLESVPARLAGLISEKINIPTIGIGAGIHCDGQVLVTHDMLGLFERFTPRFIKKYAHLHKEMIRAFGEYIHDVKNLEFPTCEHSIEMPDEEWEDLLKQV